MIANSTVPSGWRLDHVAHAVANLDEKIALYSNLFGFEVESREIIVEQKVSVAFLRLQNTLLELIAPEESNITLKKFLEKRGEGLHHICFLVDNIRGELEKLRAKGAKLIDSEPRPGAHGTEIAFIHPHSTGGALIELCGKRRNDNQL